MSICLVILILLPSCKNHYLKGAFKWDGMPTILRVKGFRFFFYSEEGNEPPHIHVIKGDGMGKIWLQPDLKTHYLINFKKNEQLDILEIVEKHQNFLIQSWYDHFR